MKEFEKLAISHAFHVTNNSRDEASYRAGFYQGFRRAKELVIRDLKNQVSYEWDEDVILMAGDSEVEMDEMN